MVANLDSVRLLKEEDNGDCYYRSDDDTLVPDFLVVTDKGKPLLIETKNHFSKDPMKCYRIRATDLDALGRYADLVGIPLRLSNKASPGALASVASRLRTALRLARRLSLLRFRLAYARTTLQVQISTVNHGKISFVMIVMKEGKRASKQRNFPSEAEVTKSTYSVCSVLYTRKQARWRRVRRRFTYSPP
jgi:hypothetical protein